MSSKRPDIRSLATRHRRREASLWKTVAIAMPTAAAIFLLWEFRNTFKSTTMKVLLARWPADVFAGHLRRSFSLAYDSCHHHTRCDLLLCGIGDEVVSAPTMGILDVFKKRPSPVPAPRVGTIEAYKVADNVGAVRLESGDVLRFGRSAR